MQYRPLGLFCALAACAIAAGSAEEPSNPRPPTLPAAPAAEATFGSALPAHCMLLLETRDARRLQERWASGPLYLAWKSEGAQGWWTTHRATQMKDTELGTLDALASVFGAADGPAAFAFGPKELVDERASAPPGVILADQPAGAKDGLLDRVRALRDRLAGEQKARARPGPGAWQIEETDGTQLGFKERAFLLTFEPKVFQALFRHQQSPPAPKDSMAPRVATARSLLPEADLTFHLSRNGLSELASAGFVFEEDQVKAFDAWGFSKDSTLDGAIKLGPDGILERHRLTLARRDGLLAVLAALPALAPAAAEVVGEETPPEALDLLPPQSSLWISLRGDLSARGDEIAKALAGLSPRMAERLQNLEKLSGAKLAELLAQVQAPVEIGVVFKRVGDDLPSAPPVEALAAMVLKNPKPLREAFEKLCEATEAFVGKEERHGGTYYFVKDNPAKPGWWLRGSLLCFASWSQGLDLAHAALEHATGTERLADRPDFRRFLAQHPIPERKTLLVYADAAQALEMPYQVARLTMGSDDPKNKWPAFHTFAAAFGSIHLEYGPAAREDAVPIAGPITADLDAETPLSLLGLLQAFRLPFEEAGW